jgi:hypothetical protein
VSVCDLPDLGDTSLTRRVNQSWQEHAFAASLNECKERPSGVAALSFCSTEAQWRPPMCIGESFPLKPAAADRPVRRRSYGRRHVRPLTAVSKFVPSGHLPSSSGCAGTGVDAALGVWPADHASPASACAMASSSREARSTSSAVTAPTLVVVTTNTAVRSSGRLILGPRPHCCLSRASRVSTRSN